MVRGMRKLPSRVPVFIIVKRRRRGFQMIAMWIRTRKKLRLMMGFRPESRVYIHERDVLKSTLEYRLKIDWLLVLRGNGGKRVISAAPGCLVVRNFRAACSGRVNEGIHASESSARRHLLRVQTSPREDEHAYSVRRRDAGVCDLAIGTWIARVKREKAPENSALRPLPVANPAITPGNDRGRIDESAVGLLERSHLDVSHVGV